MNKPTLDEQRKIVQQWEETARELEQMRRKKLRGMPYNWKEVDALLELGENAEGVVRSSEGIIEMQRLFMLAAEKMGLPKRIKNDEGE